jgi:hypothetical protein
MWEPLHLTTLRAFTAYYRNSFSPDSLLDPPLTAINVTFDEHPQWANNSGQYFETITQFINILLAHTVVAILVSVTTPHIL